MGASLRFTRRVVKCLADAPFCHNGPVRSGVPRVRRGSRCSDGRDGAKRRLLRFLASQPLFADLPPADLAPLAAVVRRRHYARGAVIFSQGYGNVAFIVRSGRVEIVVESADGRDLVLYEVGTGDHFGEMALLEGQPRSASAICTEASEILAITREDLLGELERHPSTMLGCCRP